MFQQHGLFRRAAAAAQEPARQHRFEHPQRDEAPERIPGVQLDLRLGARLTLRPLFDELPYEAAVVGLSGFDYFMARMRPSQAVAARLQASPAMAARLDMGGVSYSFYTNFLSRVTTPDSVLFLSHPETVLRVRRRLGRRLRVSIPCSVHGAFGDHEGVVVDMDRQGCRLNVRGGLRSPLRQAAPGQLVVLNLNLLRADAPFTTPLLLRRVEEGQGRISFGGVFEGLGPEVQRQLDEYMARVGALAGD